MIDDFNVTESAREIFMKNFISLLLGLSYCIPL